MGSLIGARHTRRLTSIACFLGTDNIVADQRNVTEKKSTIRFGLLCDSLILSRWQVRCIEQLLAVNGVTLELVVINSDTPPASGLKTKLRTDS